MSGPVSDHPSNGLAARIASVTDDLAQAIADAKRAPESVTLIAVSKTRPADDVRAAYALGLRDFGENFAQEAVTKVQALSELSDIVWHYIGAIQSNKTSDLARCFQWVHTVDRAKIANRLSRARVETQAQPLNVCLQVNIDAEPQKAGVAVEDLRPLIDHVRGLPHLSLRGLMAIPAATDNHALMRASFQRLRELFDSHESIAGDNWDTLSMGMSGDYPLAIAEGATMVRIGTAIFGPRMPRESVV